MQYIIDNLFLFLRYFCGVLYCLLSIQRFVLLSKLLGQQQRYTLPQVGG